MATTSKQQSRTYEPSLPNPALFTNEKHEIYLAESPELKPKPDECIVRVRCNGICGSDIHFWKSGQIGTLKVSTDYVLGHEASGSIEWIGENVTHLQVGDRVAIEPGVPCEQCFQCSAGQYNLCPDVQFSGAPPYHGSIRRYHVHPAKYLHKLPDMMSFADGALLEPLSVVLHGFERSPVRLGESTVICGAGPIGLIALAAARASGAYPLIITDVDENRLQFAEKFVPGCKAVQVVPDKTPAELGAVINDCIREAGGEQPRVVYECTGVQNSVVTAIHIPRAGGEVMVVGVGRPTIDGLPFMHASLSEIDLKFINRYHHSWPTAIRLLFSGYLDLKPLVTHRFALEDAVEAPTSSADRTTGSIKVHIEDNKE
ncbi:hypothetical protein W97_05675 [Coniosporium apollinis CBS 100218]|uniref:L-iditol 2-dehydrogenase n=1 Tax=Coniosporium apollinis (strain CBS 100218) TaxID=1168221 RepID=R7YWK0_CONA1|nr:uncharacterized protein W97_05675 [Coniosporium apollinis CBS 100218]EON66282.1 hypothetical protein W97_05675 [Coniosporium apollinis CBS 100218]